MYTAAAQIEAAGGRALPVVGDIRDEAQVVAAVALAVERFGGHRAGSRPVRRPRPTSRQSNDTDVPSVLP